MKKEGNILVVFLVGLVMLAAGLYWFTTSVTVTAGFYNLRFGGSSIGGMVVVPFIVGVCWMFAQPDSIVPKIILVLGLVIIIASIIAGTHFVFQNRNLYEYLVMIIMICGGATLTLKVLLSKPK